jgi:hypothetical protein
MVTRSPITLPVLRAVKRAAANGGIFQSQGIKADLGYADGSDEAHYMHSVIARLKKEGVIEPVDRSRQRNQYLKLVNEQELQRRIERALRDPVREAMRASEKNGASADHGKQSEDLRIPTGSAPRRVVYLEERVEQLESTVLALDGLPADFAKLREELAHTNDKLDQMIRLWS